MILSLEESVAQHKKKMFRPIFVGTMIALTFLYISFGVSGYLSFGPRKLIISFFFYFIIIFVFRLFLGLFVPSVQLYILSILCLKRIRELN